MDCVLAESRAKTCSFSKNDLVHREVAFQHETAGPETQRNRFDGEYRVGSEKPEITFYVSIRIKLPLSSPVCFEKNREELSTETTDVEIIRITWAPVEKQWLSAGLSRFTSSLKTGFSRGNNPP